MAVWDIAKKRDFFCGFTCRRTAEIVDGTASVGAQDRIVKYLDIVHIDKFQNVPYTEATRFIAKRQGHTSLANNADLLIDGTGVGEAVADMLRALFLAPIPIVFTSGGHAHPVYADMGSVFGNTAGTLKTARILKEWDVPKADLVAAGKILLEQGRVRVAPGLKYAEDLKEQLEAFRGKVNERTGRTKYENEEDATHDDMVVCLLMASWWFLREDGVDDVQERVIPQDKTAPAWEPSDNW